MISWFLMCNRFCIPFHLPFALSLSKGISFLSSEWECILFSFTTFLGKVAPKSSFLRIAHARFCTTATSVAFKERSNDIILFLDYFVMLAMTVIANELYVILNLFQDLNYPHTELDSVSTLLWIPAQSTE
jgi:hypothetical protein